MLQEATASGKGRLQNKIGKKRSMEQKNILIELSWGDSNKDFDKDKGHGVNNFF